MTKSPSLVVSLQQVLTELRVDAAEGCLLAAGEGQVYAVESLGNRLIQMGDVEVEDAGEIARILTKEGLLDDHARYDCDHQEVHTGQARKSVVWSLQDVFTRADNCLPVTLISTVAALYIPPREAAHGRILVDRFVANLSDPLPKIYAATLFDDFRIVALTPLMQIEESIESPPPNHPSVLDHRGRWCKQGAVGGLQPAVEAHVRRHKCAYVSTARAAKLLPRLDAPAMFGSGVGDSYAQAKAKAIGEAYERHLAGLVLNEMVFEARGADLPEAIHPDRFVSYLPEQFAAFPDLYPYDRDECRLWTRARRVDGSTCAVLADLVFYPLGRADSRVHTSTNSSGMAAGESREAALAYSWAELVERHAFMKTWLGKLPSRRISWPGDGCLENYRTDLACFGWEIHLFQIGDIGLEAVVLAVARAGEYLTLGCAADRVPYHAVSKAVAEAWMGVALCDQTEGGVDVEAVRLPSDHRRLYRWRPFAEELSFLFQGEEFVSLEDLDPVRPVADDAVVVTWPGWASDPLHVVRVLHPDLIPITFGRGREPLGRQDVQQLVGNHRELPLFPHPFP